MNGFSSDGRLDKMIMDRNTVNNVNKDEEITADNQNADRMIADEQPAVRKKKRFDYHDSIIWIILVTVFWYVLVFSMMRIIFESDIFLSLVDKIVRTEYMRNATKFTIFYYLATLPMFLGAIIYTAVTKRNRFILRSFFPQDKLRSLKLMLCGLLVGFLMNGSCILCAILNGDIHLFLNFAVSQMPLYCFALICVFIQSASEELWVRGFMYERINVRYPLWVGIVVSSVFFGLLHATNTGVTVFAVVEICVGGLMFAMSKWYAGNIWFPAGIHTAWNFTQNYLFGLPNSGLVSEVSVFGLDAATARSSLVYSVPFGVEGAVPSLVVDALVCVVCLLLAKRAGRAHELFETKVTPRKDPLGPQPI